MMNLRGILIIAMTFIGTAVFGQDDFKKAYQGLSIDIDLSDSGLNCKKVVFFDDSGITRENKKKPCIITLHFNKLGKQSFTIRDAESGTIKTFKYYVVELPKISAKIGLYDSGYISISELLAYKSLRLECENPDFKEPMKIETFKYEHTGANVDPVKRLNMRGKFNTEISNLILRVKEKDKIHFSDIEIRIGEFNPILIDPLSLRVTD